MNTCHDCIHEVVCSALIEKGLPWADGECPAEAFCMAFRYKSDWINVTEKNPEDVYGMDREKISVLVCTKSGKVSESTRCAAYKFDKQKLQFVRTGDFYWSGSKNVTHWMLLPEPPQMKGGA